MLVPGDDVILLPVCTPLRAGGRRHRDHHRAPHRLLARDPAPGRRGPQRVAPVRRRGRRVRPDLAAAFRWPTTRRCARRSREVVPVYAGIETLADTGDQVQWGGRHLCAGGVFPTADGPGRVQPARADRRPTLPDGQLHGGHPPGQAVQLDGVRRRPTRSPGRGRDAVYIDEADAAALGLGEGDACGCASRRRARIVGRLKLVRLPRRIAAGALARGQRVDRRRARPPRARLAGARLQRRRHPRTGLRRV